MKIPAPLAPLGLAAIISLAAGCVPEADQFLTISDCEPPVDAADEGELELRCRVTSHASQAVAAFAVKTAFSEPGRPIPWGEEYSYHEIAGGLMRGEARVVTLKAPDVSGLPYGEDSALSFEVIWVNGEGPALENRLYP